ncbi:MAG: peptidoglycan editing factor PgeF [Aeromonas sp.]
MQLITPTWPAPAHVRAYATTRLGGVSQGVFAGLNLGEHVGDDPAYVAANRAALARELGLTAPLHWLNQVHGVAVHRVSAALPVWPANADAAISRLVGAPAVVMTADCLPVLFCDTEGRVVSAAHAGWRGLCDGVLEATVVAMGVAPKQVLAWLGPAIGPQAFEVGAEVRAAFIAQQAAAAQAFVPSLNVGKWLADIYQLARLRLQAAGVEAIYGGDYCTHSDSAQFYSYRRDGQTGRLASLIWLSA